MIHTTVVCNVAAMTSYIKDSHSKYETVTIHVTFAAQAQCDHIVQNIPTTIMSSFYYHGYCYYPTVICYALHNLISSAAELLNKSF